MKEVLKSIIQNPLRQIEFFKVNQPKEFNKHNFIEEKESMNRDDVNEKSPYFLHVDIQKEISSYGVEQKMNDYIGLQKTILPILEQEGFYEEIINEEAGMAIEITKKGIKETLGSGRRFQKLTRRLKELKIAIIRSLPEIIRKAHLSQDNVMNFHGDSSRYAYFVLETELNGLDVRIRIDVRKTSAKNKFWLHMIDINEKNPITQS